MAVGHKEKKLQRKEVKSAVLCRLAGGKDCSPKQEHGDRHVDRMQAAKKQQEVKHLVTAALEVRRTRWRRRSAGTGAGTVQAPAQVRLWQDADLH